MRLQYTRLNNMVKKYHEEGLTCYGDITYNGKTLTQLGWRYKPDSRRHYILFDREKGKYALARDSMYENSIVIYTFWKRYSDFKKDLHHLLEANSH